MATLELAQVVIATVATVCMIGLGFLYRPSRATAVWSFAFVLVMLTSYAAMIAWANDLVPLRLVSMGVPLAAAALLWSGLRAQRGAPAHEWFAVLVAAVSVTALLAANGTDAYVWAFRLAFAASAASAALTFVELLRRPERAGGTSMPLAAFSLVVAGVGAVSIVVGLVAPGDAGESLECLRTVNSLGMLAYVVCALVTLLFIARGGTGAATGSTFAVVAADRLARAQRAGERSWALVYAQIDDAEDLRIVAGDSGFAAIAERLRGDVIEIFPTEADLGWFAPAGVAVLVAQPSAVLRERVRTLLRAFAASGAGVRVGTSASSAGRASQSSATTSTPCSPRRATRRHGRPTPAETAGSAPSSGPPRRGARLSARSRR